MRENNENKTHAQLGINYIYYMTELVQDKKDHSDWFPKRSVYEMISLTD